MNIILMSALAGVAGTGLGGLCTALFGRRMEKCTCVFLSLAGGVMTSIVCFELIPEANAHASMGITVAGLAAGVLLLMGLNTLLDRISQAGEARLHKNYEEFYHEGGVLTNQKSLLRSGWLMFFVIGLHNIPEGLVIGAAGSHELRFGLTLALMLALHNIPEGMAIAAPLISGGMGRAKSVLLTLLSGLTTALGGAAGVLIGGISKTALALSFAAAGGAMLYAVFGEILPQSIVMSKSRLPTIVLLAGIVFGMLMTKI